MKASNEADVKIKDKLSFMCSQFKQYYFKSKNANITNISFTPAIEIDYSNLSTEIIKEPLAEEL